MSNHSMMTTEEEAESVLVCEAADAVGYDTIYQCLKDCKSDHRAD